jgi:CRISPR/Cas system-associated protein Csm6
MPSLEEISEEYRIAYRQVLHIRKQWEASALEFERTEGLALMRYRRAREEYLALALGEDDKVIAESEADE